MMPYPLNTHHHHHPLLWMEKKNGKWSVSLTHDSTIGNYSTKQSGKITLLTILGILPLTSQMHLNCVKHSINTTPINHDYRTQDLLN